MWRLGVLQVDDGYPSDRILLREIINVITFLSDTLLVKNQPCPDLYTPVSLDHRKKLAHNVYQFAYQPGCASAPGDLFVVRPCVWQDNSIGTPSLDDQILNGPSRNSYHLSVCLACLQRATLAATPRVRGCMVVSDIAYPVIGIWHKIWSSGQRLQMHASIPWRLGQLISLS